MSRGCHGGNHPEFSERAWRSIKKRLREKREIRDDGCWDWTGSTNQFGYGLLCTTDGGPNIVRSAHRLAYAVWVGKIDPHKVVMHTCDNRRCINPDHLVQGTQGDNMRDMVAKGRHVSGTAVLKERAAVA